MNRADYVQMNVNPITMRYSLLLILGLAYASCSEIPLAETPNGKIQGTFRTSYGGREYTEFVGIPYAKAPIGNLRFEESQPAEPWKGVWIANQSTSCLQVSHWPKPAGGISAGQEDCLHVNVYVPNKTICPKANLDVIVHIHGGCFMYGAGNAYTGPKYLMDKDVIFVTLNYRLGVFGFLSTGDEYLPGNLGMKDQVLALKWIKNNIKYFGGNPDSITITGLSAGGASVHYHLLSPLSRNLFNKAISVSGSTLNAWTLQENPLKQARKIGEAVGCTQTCKKELVQCLKSRNGAQINEATRVLRTFAFNPMNPLGVVVDGYSKNPFLPQQPYELLKQGKVYDVPWIASATADEGLYPAAEFAVCDKNFQKMNNEWNQVAPDILQYRETVPEDMLDSVSQKIRKFYMGDKDISRQNFHPLIQMIGDRHFTADIELSARLHAKAIKSPVYLYYFNHYAEEIGTFATEFTGLKEKYGVCHGDDVKFIFSDVSKCTLPKMTPNDEQMKEDLLGIWTSFAKAGVPKTKVQWKPVGKKCGAPIDYLYINGGFTMKTADQLGQRKFWESLPFAESANLYKENAKSEL